MVSYLNELTIYSQHCSDYLIDINQIWYILFRDFYKGDEASDVYFVIVDLVSELADMISIEERGFLDQVHK